MSIKIKNEDKNEGGSQRRSEEQPLPGDLPGENLARRLLVASQCVGTCSL